MLQHVILHFKHILENIISMVCGCQYTHPSNSQWKGECWGRWNIVQSEWKI